MCLLSYYLIIWWYDYLNSLNIRIFLNKNWNSYVAVFLYIHKKGIKILNQIYDLDFFSRKLTLFADVWNFWARRRPFKTRLQPSLPEHSVTFASTVKISLAKGSDCSMFDSLEVLNKKQVCNFPRRRTET